VKLFFGSFIERLEKTAAICEGTVSFEPNPYLPPTIIGAFLSPLYAATTSRYRGSPVAPGSFALSRTAILLTVFGKAFRKCLMEKGLYNLTFNKPISRLFQ
jgi:hypothetical protein